MDAPALEKTREVKRVTGQDVNDRGPKIPHEHQLAFGGARTGGDHQAAYFFRAIVHDQPTGEQPVAHHVLEHIPAGYPGHDQGTSNEFGGVIDIPPAEEQGLGLAGRAARGVQAHRFPIVHGEQAMGVGVAQVGRGREGKAPHVVQGSDPLGGHARLRQPPPIERHALRHAPHGLLELPELQLFEGRTRQRFRFPVPKHRGWGLYFPPGQVQRGNTICLFRRLIHRINVMKADAFSFLPDRKRVLTWLGFFWPMNDANRLLLSGDEAIALAARDAGVALGAGYPGTPSTEILEAFSAYHGRAQWSPNEKVALEVAIGAAFGGARAMATMKHVGLNVASDPLFTAAYTGVSGALVIISADDPGMASSQNEQDNRRYAVAAGVPMLEPADSQEAYDFMLAAIDLSERWNIPVLLRVTTRVCHSYTVVRPRGSHGVKPVADFKRDIKGRVMIPAYARAAHRKLRQKLDEMQAWNESCSLNQVVPGTKLLGIITSGISFMHVREAAPEASVLKLGFTHPLPMKAIETFVRSVVRCVVIEEGDPCLVEAIRAAGLRVEAKPDMYRFGELDVVRVHRILNYDVSPEPAKPPGKPPQLCDACQYRIVFEALRKQDCIVAGDIGCYTLGVLQPFEAIDSCVCMGASLGVGLGLRHVLPIAQARRVVSVIGDSTFIHSGISGLVEMVYNPPATGHVLIILDNSTTAMTGHQEHPGTGRKLDHGPANRVVLEDLIRAIGVQRVHVVEPRAGSSEFERLLLGCLESNELSVIIARRPCILIAKQLRQYEARLACDHQPIPTPASL